jgi:hypothetical protein
MEASIELKTEKELLLWILSFGQRHGMRKEQISSRGIEGIFLNSSLDEPSRAFVGRYKEL